jgi:hypothetical protein
MTYKITSRFGEQEMFRLKPHTGVDFAMPIGTPLKSIQEGVIEKVTHYKDNIGNGVLVRFNDGKTAIYGHMSDISVHEGETVHIGDLLGHSGNSGFSTGAHLHFGLKEDGHFIDPSPYIPNIEHMNDTMISSNTSNFFDMFHANMSIFSDFLSNMKVQFINLFSTDYFPLIKGLQNVIEFIFINI